MARGYLLLFLCCWPALVLSQDATNGDSEDKKRTLSDIIWSCLTLIFASSWVAIHPNLPAHNDGDCKVLLRKTHLMIVGVLAPELVLFWSIRQRFGAKMLAERYKERGWTRSHGFFLLMGGFALEEAQNKPLATLTPQQFDHLLHEGRVHFPDIKQDEIQDRSKADWLGKLVVVSQTSWFVLQMIARGVSKTAKMTEIEVITLAFATLTTAMCIFWWSKPLDVKSPCRLTALKEIKKEKADHKCLDVEHDHGHAEAELQPLSPTRAKFETHGTNALRVWRIVRKINSIPVIGFFSRRIIEIIWCQDESATFGSTRLPTFYSPTMPNAVASTIAMIIVSICGLCFGAIHFIAWGFSTPSSIEKYIWKIACIAVSGAFFITLLNGLVLALKAQGRRVPFMKGLEALLRVLQIVAIPFYFLARLALFGSAIAALRDLPEGAFEEIKWASYLPHV